MNHGSLCVQKNKQDKGVEPSYVFYSFYITRQSRVNKAFRSVTLLQNKWFYCFKDFEAIVLFNPRSHLFRPQYSSIELP